MNRLVIIGNGFDMTHGLKTSYTDFINWYWNQRINLLMSNITNESEDILCKLTIKEDKSWSTFAYENSYFFKDIFHKERYSGSEVIQTIKQHPETYAIECSPFFEAILHSLETKGWVDVEYDYYQLLKGCMSDSRCSYTIGELNQQFEFLQSKLVEYLRTIESKEFRNDLKGAMQDVFRPIDFSTERKKEVLESMGLDDSDYVKKEHKSEKRNMVSPEQIMLLNFNYTYTVERYGDDNVIINYIHGNLKQPENIIFGYGDELDKSYQDILDMNNNEFLRNVKSVKYLETRHYHKLLEFLMSAPFQILIMGHSCGNSDRTLLNTVFEHKNCISIKPFYHKWEDGSDNYLELVQNISRNFTDMKLFRDRVVNKEQCQTM